VAATSVPPVESQAGVPAPFAGLNASDKALLSLHTGWMNPDYPMAYAPAKVEEIEAVAHRILARLEEETAVRIVDLDTGAPVTDLARLPARPGFAPRPLQTVSYEWGVTYAGMLLLADATGDAAYRTYVAARFEAIRLLADQLARLPADERGTRRNPVRGLLKPNSLDACGAMAGAMIKARRAGVGPDLKGLIDIDLAYITTGQQRFADGTLARNRPMPNSLWLDDLYMSVPTLAQMGALTGEARYYDDAARQLLQFEQRLFVPEKGLFMHGWVEGMTEHPAFHWGRANGWAVMATVELLSVLPEDHARRPALLKLLRAHARGLAATQGIRGLWHQLLDRPGTYEETSASAMFVFALARGINRGWLDPLAYGPLVSVGWNAVASKVDAQGGVTGTCVGTGMGWEPVFYAHRPVNVYAAHGYGPVLLAAAEMIQLRRGAGAKAVVHDGGVHFGDVPTRSW
jgi:rhamnogalacturonyl hydrolase YesR